MWLHLHRFGSNFFSARDVNVDTQVENQGRGYEIFFHNVVKGITLLCIFSF